MLSGKLACIVQQGAVQELQSCIMLDGNSALKESTHEIGMWSPLRKPYGVEHTVPEGAWPS